MIYFNAMGIISPLGNGEQEVRKNLLIEPKIAICKAKHNLPLGYSQLGEKFDIHAINSVEKRSRNNLFALAALEQIREEAIKMIKKYGNKRVAVIIGTSTSGVEESEKAFPILQKNKSFPKTYHYGQHEIGSISEFIAEELNIEGINFVHSNACASGAKAIISAARLINAGIFDAIICGGVDSLSNFVISGFSALETVNQEKNLAFSKNRNGINLGEGAALFVISKEVSDIALYGWGESSDAYHISAPSPEGEAPKRAILDAIKKAKLTTQEIDYINLHGTGTLQNDAMEAKIINEIFGDSVFCSSTKTAIGHTLGASGAIEAAFCYLVLKDNLTGKLPVHFYDNEYDTNIPKINLVNKESKLNRPLKYCLSSSFAFGGSNAALLLGVKR